MEDCTAGDCASVEIGRDQYRTLINSGRHQIIADEPESLGGTDEGFTPNQLFLSGLGACTVITLRMYADRKKWDVENIKVVVEMDTVKSEQQRTTFVKRHIQISGNIDTDQKNRMLEIAESCPMHKILINPIVISSNLLP